MAPAHRDPPERWASPPFFEKAYQKGKGERREEAAKRNHKEGRSERGGDRERKKGWRVVVKLSLTRR